MGNNRMASGTPLWDRASFVAVFAHEHRGCFSCGDLDGWPPLLPPESPNPSLKLIICVLICGRLDLVQCLDPKEGKCIENGATLADFGWDSPVYEGLEGKHLHFHDIS